MQITALDHLVLTTSNFERCVWFYRDVLGMELLCQDDHYAFRFGMQKINVHRCLRNFCRRPEMWLTAVWIFVC